MAKKNEYEVKGMPIEISATSRVALQVRDNWYTIEASEKRTIPQVEGIEMDKEWSALFDAVNSVVDEQAEDILSIAKKKN